MTVSDVSRLGATKEATEENSCSTEGKVCLHSRIMIPQNVYCSLKESNNTQCEKNSILRIQ